MAIAALTLVSCDKDKDKDKDKDDVVLLKPTYRVKDMKAYGGDEVFSYTYNANGTVAAVQASWEGTPYSNYVFSYSGTKLTVKDALDDNKIAFTATLNDKNLATQMTYNLSSSPKELTFKYDKDGFMIATYEGGNVVTVQNIVDGNVEYWTRIGIAAGVTDDVDAPGWRKKFHSYHSEDNVAGIHVEWAEDSQVKRWIYETGLLGRASVQVCKTAHWWGIKDEAQGIVKDEWAAKLAYYPLDLDAQGWIKTELKLYDTVEKYQTAPNTMEEDTRTMFVCEPIK